MDKNYNPSAFARTKNGSAGAQKGMTLRDYFAGQALAGLCAKYSADDDEWFGRRAYQIADELLEERSEKED
jgi:hypothetical protein